MLKRLLLLSWLLFWPVSVFANYEITETELQTLESNLMKLEQINQASQTESTMLKNQLTELQTESAALQNELIELKHTSATQEQLLANANKSLKQYEKEVKNRERRLKLQRNIAYGVVLAALVVAITK